MDGRFEKENLLNVSMERWMTEEREVDDWIERWMER